MKGKDLTVDHIRSIILFDWWFFNIIIKFLILFFCNVSLFSYALPNTWPTKWISKLGMESTIMVGRQEKFLNSRRSRMVKTIIFWPWWQPFNSFCFEPLSFFPLSPFFLFVTQKGWDMVPPPPSPRQPCNSKYSNLLIVTSFFNSRF